MAVHDVDVVGIGEVVEYFDLCGWIAEVAAVQRNSEMRIAKWRGHGNAPWLWEGDSSSVDESLFLGVFA